MTVPVPPSVADYTKTTYTFEDGSLSNSISTMVAQQDGKYLISYTSSWTNEFSVVSTASAIYTRKGSDNNFEYYVGAKKLRPLGETISFSVSDGFSTTTSEHPDDPTITVETPSTGYYTTITIDVNGSRKPNCSFSADCSDPDTYSVLVRYDGKIKIPTTDTYTINVLSNPLKNK